MTNMTQQYKVIIWILVIGDISLAQTSSSENIMEADSCKTCDVLVRKFEYLETKFLEQQLELKTLIEQIMHTQDNLVKIANEKMEKREIAPTEINSTDLQEHSCPDYQHQVVLTDNTNALEQSNYATSCSEESTKVSGKYSLRLFPNETPIHGYCEQETAKGGWLVIQRRFDGSVDFFRNWSDYRDGFGDIDGEFWFGLEKVHRLTRNRNHVLMIELEDLKGKFVYAQYDGFEIGSEEENYSLKKLGKYSGTAGDSLSKHHKGMMFSTKDNDNDRDNQKNCAMYVMGAWWYRSCLDSNLNGLYDDKDKRKTVTWYSFKKRLGGFKSTRMMIREK